MYIPIYSLLLLAHALYILPHMCVIFAHTAPRVLHFSAFHLAKCLAMYFIVQMAPSSISYFCGGMYT